MIQATTTPAITAQGITTKVTTLTPTRSPLTALRHRPS
jgi:hypothetical protein